jgi:glycosyltransferase involved in cell wall biosynthesis
MRVGINALLLTKQAGYRQTGVSRYIRRLIEALPNELSDDELIVYSGRGTEPVGAGEQWRRSWWPVDDPFARVAWESSLLPFAARRDRLDLFHGTVNVLPTRLNARSAVTIHDLALLRWPEQTPARRHRYLARAIPAAVKRADRVIAVSEATKADIVELLGVDPVKVAVTHLGVEDRFKPASAKRIKAAREVYGIEEPFVLYVGTLEPRKNLPNLLRAFARIQREIPHTLALAGAEGWKTREFREAVEEVSLGDRLRLLGFVDERDLPALYSAADLFAFPSLYEGFGLPVLESMACGTPVVTSNISSLPEVGGDAALLVEPSDVEGIGQAILSGLTDKELRGRLVAAGKKRAARFTWQATAKATAAAYREALS